MTAEIISIGDELLIGQTVNTNASYLGKELTGIGIEVARVITVGDKADELQKAVAAAFSRSDVVIATGGLGPTHDDITKHVIAGFFNSKLVLNKKLLQDLETAYHQRGMKMPEANRDQAMVPDNAQIIENPVGSAPGLIFERSGRRCIVLPGVPFEMKILWQESVLPMLKGQSSIILQKTLRTTGIGESSLFEKLGDIQKIEALAKVAFLPKAAGVDIRLTVRGEDKAACQKMLERALDVFKNRIGKYIYASDDQLLEEIVAQLLLKSRKTIAVAESCTGGLLANKLTNIAGSSGFFERGIVTYSNQAKMALLGVPAQLLDQSGAVSAETAEAMASGIRQQAGTNFGLSTTGIAGPTGGTAEKPVGLVYVGFASEIETQSRRFLFTKDRLINKERTVQAALNWLRLKLQA